MPPGEKAPDAAPARPQALVREIVDAAEGIDRLMGDRALYGRMLKRFRSDYAAGTAPIRAALAAGDAVLAHRHVHTLKGASGMIGARALHAQASAVELAIRTGAAEQLAALDLLDPEFDKVFQVLDPLIHAHAPPAPADPAARYLLTDPALLARLEHLLASGDGAAVDLLEASGASLRIILGEAKLAHVTAAVNEFDFEGALRALTSSAGG